MVIYQESLPLRFLQFYKQCPTHKEYNNNTAIGHRYVLHKEHRAKVSSMNAQFRGHVPKIGHLPCKERCKLYERSSDVLKWLHHKTRWHHNYDYYRLGCIPIATETCADTVQNATQNYGQNNSQLLHAICKPVKEHKHKYKKPLTINQTVCWLIIPVLTILLPFCRSIAQIGPKSRHFEDQF